MSQNTFVKKLGKELARNRKKTAVLAVISLVAIWFWIPLVWEWAAPEGSPSENNEVEDSAVGTSSATVSAAAPTNGDSVTKEIDKLHWRRLAELFAGHPQMASAKLPAGLTMPFGQPPTEEPIENEETTEEEQTEEVIAVAAPTPAELGLTLSSTLVGAGKKIAIINGQTCELGAVLVVPHRAAEVEMKLVAIGPDLVELLNGRKVQRLQRADTSHQVEMSLAGGQGRLESGSDANRILIPTHNRE